MYLRRCAVILIGCALALFGTLAAADTINPALFGALKWRSVGPYRGGRALAVTGIPGDPYTSYFGAVAGGVWKTTDGGATWAPLTDGTPISSVGALGVAPSDHRVIYVGTGEAPPRGDMTYGDGVYKSVDGGKTWAKVLYHDEQTGAIDVSFDPNNPRIVYAALWQARRQPWNFSSGGPGSGLYRSGDG